MTNQDIQIRVLQIGRGFAITLRKVAILSATAALGWSACSAESLNELAPDPDASTYFIDAHVRLRSPYFGCASQDDLDKVKAMQRKHDLDAMIVAARRGGCRHLNVGDGGSVSDHSVWHGSTCLRQVGDPDCVWVPDAVIEKDVPTLTNSEPDRVSPKAVDSPRCKTVVAKIVARTGALVTGTSPSGENVFMSHPIAADMILACPGRLSVSVSWKTGRPTAAYFSLLASAGAVVTGETEATLKPLIKRCQAIAHGSKDEIDEENLTHAEIDCNSADREGGGIVITVSTGKDDPLN